MLTARLARFLRSRKSFWKEILRQSTSKVPCAEKVGSAHSEQDIANLFMSHYDNTLNSVRDNDDVSAVYG